MVEYEGRVAEGQPKDLERRKRHSASGFDRRFGLKILETCKMELLNGNTGVETIQKSLQMPQSPGMRRDLDSVEILEGLDLPSFWIGDGEVFEIRHYPTKYLGDPFGPGNLDIEVNKSRGWLIQRLEDDVWRVNSNQRGHSMAVLPKLIQEPKHILAPNDPGLIRGVRVPGHKCERCAPRPL